MVKSVPETRHQFFKSLPRRKQIAFVPDEDDYFHCRFRSARLANAASIELAVDSSARKAANLCKIRLLSSAKIGDVLLELVDVVGFHLGVSATLGTKVADDCVRGAHGDLDV